jgi:hypothetical protein
MEGIMQPRPNGGLSFSSGLAPLGWVIIIGEEFSLLFICLGWASKAEACSGGNGCIATLERWSVDHRVEQGGLFSSITPQKSKLAHGLAFCKPPPLKTSHFGGT